MKEQLIILVFYINLKTTNHNQARERYKHFQQEVDSGTWPDGYIVKSIVLPVEDRRDTYVECLYPKDATETTEILKKIEHYNKIMKKWVGTH